MKKILISKDYYYLPIYNLLLNGEVLSMFEAHFPNKQLQLKEINIDSNFLQKKLKETNQIILSMVNFCNMQCPYCVYGGDYLYEKQLTGEYMSIENAKKGLEIIYEYIHRRFDKSFTVSFYGGEPFLRFDLIKEIVSFAKTLFEDWNLSFGATTNATVLTEEMIDYLITENFNITISLDGPEENHDSKRIFKNGTGSFQKVWENIGLIESRNSKYFKEKVSFNIVHSFDQSLEAIYRFFSENELLHNNRVRYNQVTSKATDYYNRIEYDMEEVNKAFQLIFEKIKEKIRESKELVPIEDIFKREFLTNKHFNTRPRDILSGTCFFNSHLYLDFDGRFHLCEKINNTFSIGDVWKGFDFNLMNEIVRQFAEIKKQHCSNCDVNYLCRPCYVMFSQNGKLGIDESLCSNSRKRILEILDNHIRIEEYKKALIESDESKIFQFHQFVSLMKGPMNSVLANFLNGDIFQVSNRIIQQFEKREYDRILEFIESAKENDLIISVSNKTWIPRQDMSEKKLKFIDEIEKNDIVLCIEEGVDITYVKEQTSNFDITQIIFYYDLDQNTDIRQFFPGTEIIYEKLDFSKCSSLSNIKKTDFLKADEDLFYFSQICNNCWGHKISITKDGMLRPCIFSNIIIDDLSNLTKPGTVEKLQSYWYITKEKVEKCKACELRFFCFDCRELSQRENNGNLFAANPSCQYNPYTGEWNE